MADQLLTAEMEDRMTWKPISSAPRDGTRYLATDGDDYWVENCPEGHEPGRWTYHSGRWRGAAMHFFSPATHWQAITKLKKETDDGR